MARPFLQQIAEHFMARHGQELYRYRFIFHNQRAGIFLCHYIEQAAEGRVVLMPECTTVNSLLRRYLHYTGGEDPNSDLLVIHSIYLAYLSVMGLKPEERSFEDFYDLGASLLHDFDDIDKHLVDVDPFIKNLIDHKELEEPITEYLSKRQWSAVTQLIYGDKRDLPQPQATDPEKGDRLKKSFLDFWMKLPEIYHTSRRILREERLAYEGMMLRDAAEQIADGQLDLTADGMITVFVGLNAQTPAMYRILDHFRDSGRALFYWDYFTEPIVQSPDLAGSFRLTNTTHYPAPTGTDRIDFDTPHQEEELRTALLSTPSSVAQTSAIGKLLSDEPKEGEWSKILHFLSPKDGAPLYDPSEPLRTAVVLPDENLLLPLLSNLPERVDAINVTMGYPIKGIPSAAMISALLKFWDLYYQRRRRYRLREVIDILRLSALSQLFADPTIAEERSRLEDHMLREKMYFTSAQQMYHLIEEKMPTESRAREVLLTIFEPLPTAKCPGEEIEYPSGETLTTQILRLIDLLIPAEEEPAPNDREEEEEKKEVDTDSEILRYIRRSIIRPQIDSQQSYRSRHPEEADRLFTFPVVRDLLRTTIGRARVPFSGEPLQGMQIMGILETRGLDFDTIIIPDASEGILPRATILDTTIPFSLRKAYGLPSTDLQEQTRAYNFFRLMARARRVVFLYDSRTSDTSTGEPSRYVQLLRDIYGIPMLEVEASYDLTAQAEPPLFEPDQELIAAYRDQLQRGEKHLSATLMKYFHMCPRRFYYSAIVGLRDEENISGLMEARDSGNVFHGAMKILYSPYEGGGKLLTEQELKRLLEGSTIDEAVSLSAERQHYQSPDKSYNGNYIAIARRLVRRMVEADLQRVREGGPITYIGGELTLTCKYEGIDFKLIIDRLDMQGDAMHVIDYKTGGDEYEWKIILPAEGTPIEDNFRDAKPINGAILQLLYYCDLLRRCRPEIDGQKYSYARLHPHIIKPHDPEIGKEEIQIRYRFAGEKGNNYTGPVSLTELGEELPQLIDQLRGAVRLIQDPDFDFTVAEGHKDACKYCPAASLCDKYTS